MGTTRTIQRHRGRQHQHSLIRLRERYLPDAQMADVIAIRDLAREAAKGTRGAYPLAPERTVFVSYQGQPVKVVYDLINNAVRTVLPRNC